MIIKALILLSVCIAIQAIQEVPAHRVTNDTPLRNVFTLGNFRAVAYENVAISFDFGNSSVVILQRGSDNNYSIIDSRQTTTKAPTIGDVQNLNLMPLYSTNGNWISVVVNPTIDFYQLDANGHINQSYTLQAPNTTGWIFPDNTFVSLGLDAIRTYEFDGQMWHIVQEDEPEQYKSLIPSNILVELRPTLMKVGSNYFTGFTTNSTFVYKRQANRSWSLIALIPTEQVPDTAYRHVMYNGVDTVVITSVASTGLDFEVAKIYTKTNEQWILTQTLYVNELRLNAQGYFPMAAEMVSSDSFVVSAPLDIVSVNQTGSLFWYDRDSSGIWRHTRRIRSTMQNSIIGFGIAPVGNNVLSYGCDILVDSLSCYLVRAEQCYLDPTNVTCHDQVSNSCDTNITLTDYYTLNTPNCGTVKATLDSFEATDSGITLNLRFTRDGSEDVTCTATKQCNRPTAPTAASVPVSVPRTSRVSAGVTLVGVISHVVTFCVALVLILIL